MPDPQDDIPTSPPTVGDTTSTGTRFRILRPHAKGGLGEVFVAADEELHREVALKQMQDRAAQDPASRARFLLEAEVTGGLEHPGIVPVYGLGTYADGRPYYAMRFIRGDSLKEAIERFHRTALGAGLPTPPQGRPQVSSDQGDLRSEGRRGRTPAPSASAGFSSIDFRKLLQRFVDVCNAIQYAHDRGVLHRDLKPGNIMLGPYGETLVVDWGLAKPVGKAGEPGAATTGELPEPILIPQSGSGVAETQAGSAIGTPQYMSPEQAAGRLDLLGPASDVYSLGATLYCLLTGMAPFDPDDLGSLLRKVGRSEFPPPRNRNPHIPRPLEAICLRAMARRTTDRYASPRQLADDVERWLANDPVLAWPEPWLVRVRRWMNKNKTLVSSAAVAVMVLFLGAGAARIWYVKDQARRETEVLARASRVNTGVSDNVADANKILDGLQSRLDDANKSNALLSDSKEWESLVARAKIEVREARGLATGDEHLLTETVSRGLADVQARLKSAEGNLKLATELDDIRMEAAVPTQGTFDPSRAGPKYVNLFARLGLDLRQGDPKQLADKAVQSGIRFVLVSSMDHWAEVLMMKGSKDRDLLPRLLEVARLVDPEPWRDRFRQVEAWRDPAKRVQLAAEVEPSKQSAQVLVALAAGLPDTEALTLMRASLIQHPGDFWLHFDLANRTRDPLERVVHFQAALAIRPDSAPTYNNLGNALRAQKDLPRAEAAYRKSLDIDPKCALTYNNLGNVFADRLDLAAAEAAYRKAIDLDPKLAIAHYNVGNILHDKRDMAGASVALKAAIDIEANDARFYASLGTVLLDQKDVKGALSNLQNAVRLDPVFAMAHNDLGAAYYAQKDFAAASASFRKAIDLDPKLARAYHNLGLALRKQGRIREAFEMASKAVELGWKGAAHTMQVCQAILPIMDRDKAIPPVVPPLSTKLPKSFVPLRFNGELTGGNPLDIYDPTGKSFRAGHLVPLRAGQAYQIDLIAKFDPFLRIEDQIYQTLVTNDDVTPPQDLNSRIVFTPSRDDVYRLVATSFKPGQTGPYTLAVNEVSPVGKPAIYGGEFGKSPGPEAVRTKSLLQALKGRKFDTHETQLAADRSYVIEVEGDGVDLLMVLVSPEGERLVENDDANPDSNALSRIDYTPKTAGAYTLVVTTSGREGRGSYTLRVQGYAKVNSK